MKKTILIDTIICCIFLFVLIGSAHTEESAGNAGTTESGITENIASQPETTDPSGQSSDATASDAGENAVQESSGDTTTETSTSGGTQEGKGSIARAQFTTAMQDREPVDDITTLSSDHDRVYFFTDLVDLEGTTITHRWEYQGTVMAEISFKVGASRWRVYSSKNLKPEWTGSWSVTVLNEQGTPLKVSNFELLTKDSAN